MFRNFFTVAWRNITRNKGFSFINIGGLALGTTCSVLILLWVNDEMNVDGLNANRGIYTVYERLFSDGKVDAGPWAPGVLANELKLQIPEIKYATGFWTNSEESLFAVGEKKLSIKGVAADSDFFKIFNYTLLEGTATSALRDPNDIAISKKMALAFFGSTSNAFNNTIRMDNRKDFKITAVFDDVPDNASQQFDFVSNWPDILESIGWLKSWIYRGPFTYIQLQPGADAEAVERKIKDFVTPHLSATGEGFRTELGLQRYDEMYLHSNFVNGVPQGGRIEYVRLFSLVAVFIVLIACINFMNLATARAVKRAKEVGIRKTVGAARRVLIFQHLGEALWISFLAGVVAFTAVASLLPAFNILTGKHIALPLTSPSFWAAFIALQCVTGFIAGSYPAFFLSSLNPVKILKGSLKVSTGALTFRKALVVFQFVMAIAMTTCTIVISRQVSFIQTRNLGYDKDNLIYIPMRRDLIAKYDVFRQEMLRSTGIDGVTRSTNAPTDINTHEYDFAWEGKPEDLKVVAIDNGIGYDFLKVMNIGVLEGRNFSREFPSDSTAFIINETALKATGYKDPIGKPLHFLQRNGTIVGVVPDFHLTSLREPIKPLVLFLGEEATWGFTLVKVQPGQTQEAIASVKKAYDQLSPEFPLRYFFADQEYQKLYNSEQTVSKLSNLFSAFAIFISCLGLLGLTLFTVEQRTKEIGVRKVIGASTIDILSILSQSIIKLLLIAAFISVPVSWFAMDKWLQNFAVRIPLSIWLFVMATGVTLVIALLIISYHAIKAATANPIKSLRVE